MGKWSSEKLKKLGYTYTGLSGKTLADFGEGMPYIPYMNVFSNAKINPEHLEYVRIKKHEKQNCVISGDALFTTSSETPEEVGMSSVLADDLGTVYLNSFCFGYRLYDKVQFDSIFLAYALRGNFVRQQMFISAQGSTRHNLSKRNFNKTVLRYPVSVTEQCKIGEILAAVDETITKTRALIEKYIAIKRGLMQDLLGKNQGEYYAISEIADTQSGGTPSRMVAEYFSGDIPWVTTSELNDNCISTTREKISIKGLQNSSAKLFPPNTVLMAMYGATIGKLGILGIEATTNQACCAFFCSKKIHPKYLYYKLLFMREKIIALGSGAGQPNISQSIIKKIKLFVPDRDTIQIQVVSKLTAADERIQSERNYLAKLLDIKKGLMHDLLTNVVPVDALLKEDLS